MQRGIHNRNLQKPEFYYPKPEPPHAAFCSRRRPVLSIDVVQTQKRAVGTDRLLPKGGLGVNQQAALLPSAQVWHSYISPHRRGCQLQGQSSPHRT